MTYQFTSMDGAGAGVAVFHRWSKYARQNQLFVETLNRKHNLSLRYNGEGVPGITNKAIFALLKQQRRRMSASDTEEIFARQNNLCAICKEQPPVEIDHKTPIFEAFSNDCHERSNLHNTTSTYSV